MFRKIALLGTVGLAAMCFSLGCDDNPSAQKADNSQEAAAKNAEALKESAQAAGTAVGGEAQRQAEKAADKTAEIASDTQKAVNDQARDLAKKVEQMITERRWPEAEKLMDQLEALKPQLNAEWQSRVDSARAALTNAKKAAGAG